MRFDDWLDAERGRLKRVAEHFGVSPSAVSQWRANGVPVDNILPLHEFTGKEVSLEDLVTRPPVKEIEVVAPRSDASPQQAALSPRREQYR